MASRAAVVLVAVAMLVVPATAIAGDGHTTIGAEGAQIESDDQHETRITLPAEEGTGAWGPVLEGEVPAVNLAVLPGGQILYYSGVEANESADETTDLHFIWNATPIQSRSRVATLTDDDTLEVTTPTPASGGYYDLFCSGTTITPEGLTVAPGATEYYTLDEEPPANVFAPLKGWNQTMIFPLDPTDTEQTWIQGPNMSEHRWYPSALQLPDGDTLVASGIQTLFYPHTYNTELETFDPDEPEQGWQQLPSSIQVADASVPQNVLPEPDTGVQLADETHQGLPNLPMYPRLHVVPGGPNAGEVLYTSHGDVWGPFGQHAVEPVWGHFQTLDPDYGSWEVHPRSNMGTRNLGATVPLMVDATDPEPRYLSFGGTIQQSTAATSTAEIIDASGEVVTSQLTDSMHFPRWSTNGVLLPDGSALAIGGSTYDNVMLHGSPTVGPLNIERFVPSDDGVGGEWELGPAMEGLRAYHSTAVLMPDARVLVGGHVPLPAFHDEQRSNGNPQPVDTTFQLYDPGYLDRPGETRPTVAVNPTEASAVDLPGATALHVPDDQATFELEVDGLEEGLDSVVLRRPGATTHQYNADQLGIEANVVAQDLDGGSGTLTVENPLHGTDALEIPPGHYMAFVNEDTDDGVYPSKAAWIALGDDVTGDAPGGGY